MNQAVAPAAKYIQLESNVGRACIRNLFLKYAQYPYLLFIDCDSIIPDGYLQRYVAELDSRPSVVCGGRVYDVESNDRAHRLRYTYGVQCESKNAEVRRKNPYRSFMTNNFMVHRSVLEQVPFDERISRYGHEDTLFGYRLMQQGIPVTHIENPVVNGDVEPNGEFLRKTQEGLCNLVEIYRWLCGDKDFVQQVSLLRFHEKVNRLHLNWVVRLPYGLFRKWLESGFESGRRVGKRWFMFYKLGYFEQKLHE